jgi:adenylate cyclase
VAAGEAPGGGSAELVAWLVRQGCDTDDLGAIFAGACERLVALGLPIWRATLSVPTIDPAIRALSYIWTPGGFSTERIPPNAAAAAAFERSPIFHLRQRNEPTQRWNLEDPEVVRQFVLFQELRALGATEYALCLIPFSAGRTALSGIALSVATDRPGGFDDAELTHAMQVLPALALASYRIGLLHVATETLGAYLGPQTGAHVLQGMIRRGDSQTIAAALLLADLRGFTALADRADGGAVVGWLNEHLEAIGDPVGECGGEVLKFLGDGLLAVFPADAGDARTACANALAAAGAALARNAALNARRDDPRLELSLVLHFGDVVYGNVGTARRLDFTVIGQAVNEASRMETLGKSLGQPLLLSATFARNCGRDCVSLGRHRLRGIAAEREIFVLAAPA